MADWLVIVGASARAAACSARRAGYQAWCVDLFADRDLRAMAPVTRCPAEAYPEGLPALLADAPLAPVLFTGALENHPAIIEEIARARPLLGSPAAAVREARNPSALEGIPTMAGLGICRSWLAGQTPVAPARSAARRKMLLKPLAGGAGRGIDWWNSPVDSLIPSGHVVQDFIPGAPISAVYRAGREGVMWLGATRQLIGEATFGAHAFQYAGSMGPLALTARQIAVLQGVGQSVAQRCGLRGLFGIDLIRDPQGILWPIEINPRYPASAEIVESASGVSVLDPRFELPCTDHAHEVVRIHRTRVTRVHGKAIVFARSDCIVPDLYAWHSAEEIADVPEPGERIRAHRPICTLLTSAGDHAACLRRLRDMAGRLYTRLES